MFGELFTPIKLRQKEYQLKRLRENVYQVNSTRPSDSRIFAKAANDERTKLAIGAIYENRPGGLLHVRVLSKAINDPIRVWRGDRVLHVFGKKSCGSGVDIEYNERTTRTNRSKENDPPRIGHWTLRGGRNPTTIGSYDKNDCLYNVIASQTGIEASELRRLAATAIRRNKRLLPEAATDLSGVEAKIGGARYVGTSPRDAQRILDNSQTGQCHPEGRNGHPRGHASHPPIGRVEDTVETYSYSRWRSGFLSRKDQDLVCHYTLITNRAQNLMAALNGGQLKADAHISRRELDYDPLPNGQKWQNGLTLGSPGEFGTVCLVGKHFLHQQNNPEADIFVLTFYPIL